MICIQKKAIKKHLQSGASHSAQQHSVIIHVIYVREYLVFESRICSIDYPASDFIKSPEDLITFCSDILFQDRYTAH